MTTDHERLAVLRAVRWRSGVDDISGLVEAWTVCVADGFIGRGPSMHSMELDDNGHWVRSEDWIVTPAGVAELARLEAVDNSVDA